MLSNSVYGESLFPKSVFNIEFDTLDGIGSLENLPSLISALITQSTHGATAHLASSPVQL